MSIIKNWNDVLALIVLLLIIGVWITQGLGYINLAGEIIGATIVGWTLVIQYYFRRAPETPTP